jgi:hypothetical protein
MTLEVEPSSLPATRSPHAKSRRQRPFTVQRTAGEPMNPAFQGLAAEAHHNWRLEWHAIDWHVICSSGEADCSLTKLFDTELSTGESDYLGTRADDADRPAVRLWIGWTLQQFGAVA